MECSSAYQLPKSELADVERSERLVAPVINALEHACIDNKVI